MAPYCTTCARPEPTSSSIVFNLSYALAQLARSRWQGEELRASHLALAVLEWHSSSDLLRNSVAVAPLFVGAVLWCRRADAAARNLLPRPGRQCQAQVDCMGIQVRRA
ncbi:hypothetical protein Vafri_13143 [Volvox africanus]|uniref:Uncharacterized protein n=1 Tax=Volvox africanus TaxID=51714 RepID=A0A8J4BFZ7_9CHLO|nr:hypothetical protein Vafri_13143 [Volvox africanus]